MSSHNGSTHMQASRLFGASKRIKKVSLPEEQLPTRSPIGGGPGRICDTCCALKLDVLIKTMEGLNLPNWQSRADIQWPVPWYKDERGGFLPRALVDRQYLSAQGSSCVLCRILAMSCLDTDWKPTSEDSSDQENDCEILLRTFGTAPLLDHRSATCTKALSLIVVPRGYPEDLAVYQHVLSKGCATLWLDSASSEVFMPRDVSLDLDTDLVGSWIQYCLKHHKTLCQRDNISVRGVKVIDCFTNLIEYWREGTPYVSLSYVWGTSKDVTATAETKSGRRSLPQLLPSVIIDSIAVTKALGFRFLWIDKFCIDQDAPELKHEQIQQMDAIYHNADLTLISAAGQNETCGLPGVGSKQRPQQLVAHLDGASILYNPKDPHEAIKQSCWSTRGWTFQEALLSRRRLVFTEHQVYYQCDTMNCFESVHCPLDKLHVRNKTKTYETLRAGLFGQNRRHQHGKTDRNKHTLAESFGQYLTNVEDYTSRTLRFEDDSLNAFRGILRHFSRQRYAFQNVWGLAYPANCSDSLTCFVHALTWMRRRGTMPQRRLTFPSWAWAGWGGPVQYEFSYSSKIWFNNGFHEVQFRTTTGQLERFENLDGQNNHPVLRVKATTLSSPQITYQPEQSSYMPWRILKRNATLSLSASVYDESDLLSGFKDTSQWQCIFVGSALKSSFVMILRARTDGITWERAGMFLVETYSSTFEKLGSDEAARQFDIV